MGFANRAFVAAGVGFAVSALVGCGSGGRLLTASEAYQLNNQLNHASAALDDHRCTAAEDWLERFQETVAALGGVNSTLVENLNQGASTIADLTSSECASYSPPVQTDTKTATTPTTTTETATFPTQTTPTTTTTPTVTTITTSSATTTTTTPTTTPTVTTITTAPPPSGGTGLGDTTTGQGYTTTTTTTSGAVTSGAGAGF